MRSIILPARDGARSGCRWWPALSGAVALLAAALPPAVGAQGLRFGLESLRSFDVSVTQGHLHLLAAGTTADGGTGLRYVRSEDGGGHFSPPVVVGAGQPPPHNPHRGADVQLAATGDRLLAVWSVTGSGYGGSGPLATALSDDGGRTFRPGPNPADDDSDSGHGYIALASDGEAAHAVWLDSRSGAQGLRYARSPDAGASWQRNESPDTVTCECCWNALLAGPGGELFALYRDKDPRDMVLAVRGEQGWQRRSTVGAFGWQFNGCPHVGGALAWAGATQTLHALVWTGQSGQQGLWSLRSADRGAGWSAPVRLGGERARHADLVAVGEHLVAVWDERDGTAGPVIRMARSSDDGQHWSAPQTLSDAPGLSHPRVVSAGGKILALWTQSGADGRSELGIWRAPIQISSRREP